MTVLDRAIKILDSHGIQWRFNGYAPGSDALEDIQVLDQWSTGERWIDCPGTIDALYIWLQY